MYEALRIRVEAITDRYAELVEKRLKEVQQEGGGTRQDGYAMSDTVSGLRYAVETLEIVNRISKEND